MVYLLHLRTRSLQHLTYPTKRETENNRNQPGNKQDRNNTTLEKRLDSLARDPLGTQTIVDTKRNNLGKEHSNRGAQGILAKKRDNLKMEHNIRAGEPTTPVNERTDRHSLRGYARDLGIDHLSATKGKEYVENHWWPDLCRTANQEPFWDIQFDAPWFKEDGVLDIKTPGYRRIRQTLVRFSSGHGPHIRLDTNAEIGTYVPAYCVGDWRESPFKAVEGSLDYAEWQTRHLRLSRTHQ